MQLQYLISNQKFVRSPFCESLSLINNLKQSCQQDLVKVVSCLLQPFICKDRVLFCVYKHPLVWKQVSAMRVCFVSAAVLSITDWAPFALLLWLFLRVWLTSGQLSLQACYITFAGFVFMCNLPNFLHFSLFDTDATGWQNLIVYIVKKQLCLQRTFICYWTLCTLGWSN